MFISRISFKRGPELFKLLKLNHQNNGYITHQLLWSLFPNDGNMTRDFLFCKNEKAEFPQYLIVSEVEPTTTEGMVIETKPYSPKLQKDQKLSFNLIANPVVSRKEEGQKNSSKHDVWMDAKKRAQADCLTQIDIIKVCEDATKTWLIEQGQRRGFCVDKDELLIDGYTQYRIYKKRQTRPIQYSSIHYEGFLTVIDPDKFISTLYNGLGRSKAFGCGLMLIRKV